MSRTTPNMSLPDTYVLKAKRKEHSFWWSWEDYKQNGISISFDDGFEEKPPTFQQSLDIERYLQGIGIDYKPVYSPTT